MGFLQKLFGSHSDHELKRIYPIADKIEALEPQMQALSDGQLRAKTDEFKARYQSGEDLDSILPEAFAVAREPIHQYMLFCLSKWMPELVRSFRLDKHRDIHYCIYEAIKAKDFAACQSDYAAMIESYTRVNWSMPEVG